MNSQTRIGILFAALALWACGTKDVAGGTSEETNAIAGIVRDSSGVPVKGAIVQARAARLESSALAKSSLSSGAYAGWLLGVADSTVSCDTTDAQGRWSISLYSAGDYGIVVQYGSLSSYQQVSYAGQPLELSSSLGPTASLEGRVSLSGDSSHSPVRVALPGTPWSVWSDTLGAFRFGALPAGDYSFVVYSPDPQRYASTTYFVRWAPGAKVQALGPLPVQSSIDTELASVQSSLQWELPLDPEYGLQGWWSFDYFRSLDLGFEVADARGHSGTARVLGDSVQAEGYYGQALRLRGSSQYALIEDDRSVLSGAKALTVEAWVYLEALPPPSEAPHNLFGKLTTGADSASSLFSVALSRGACGTDSTVFAFLLSTGSGLRCSEALLSSLSVPVATWTHLAAVWSGDSLYLYQNGVLAGSRSLPMDSLPSIQLPVYFGKSDLSFRIDEVRLGTEALGASDVLYRYRLFSQTAKTP